MERDEIDRHRKGHQRACMRGQDKLLNKTKKIWYQPEKDLEITTEMKQLYYCTANESQYAG